jgi:hypothetical protein
MSPKESSALLAKIVAEAQEYFKGRLHDGVDRGRYIAQAWAKACGEPYVDPEPETRGGMSLAEWVGAGNTVAGTMSQPTDTSAPDVVTAPMPIEGMEDDKPKRKKRSTRAGVG